MRKRCLRAKRRRAAEAAPRPPVKEGKPVTLAETAGEAKEPAKRLQSIPLLEKWPRDYTGFRLDGRDVVFFAPGKPELRIECAF